MATNNKLSKSEKLLNALNKRAMSAAQIVSSLKIPNPRATVHYLRTMGHDITTDESGPVTKYYAR